MSVVSIPDAVAINVAGQCDCGKVREENQDTVCHISTRLGDLLVVAEGVGGFAGSGQASRVAVDTISSSVEGMPAFFPPEIAVEEAICHANAAITAAAGEPDCPDRRMGTKVVVALLRTDADRARAPVQAIIGSVGDGRAYLVHDQGLTRLTRDHHAVQDPLDNKQVTPQEAETHPYESMLTRYLGQELNVQVEMREVPLEVGDTLLLCSDGLWGYVSEQTIERTLTDGARSVEEASRALLNLALDAGGYDNVAIEIARLTQCGDSAPVVACAVEPGAVEPTSDAPPEITPVCEFASASDVSQSDWPNSPLILDRINSVTELPSPKRKKVFSLIRDLGRRISDKETMGEKPATAEPVAPWASGVQPTLSWATPGPIAYGTRLSSVQLNATASVQGKFLYTPGPGYALPAGSHTLWVTFHAANSPEDNPVLAAVSINVSKATPSIEWPAPSNVLPGVALDAAQLNASASVPGAFEYSPRAGEVLPDGTHTLSVTFNPQDKANYTTAQATVSVTVAKTVPEIDWTSPEPISYGTPLSAAELNASASVPGTFEYSPAAGEVLPAGSHTLSVTFTPSDGMSYARALAAVPLTVTRGIPAIVWPGPERITYGTALNHSQLNATASVPGTFVYNPGPGAVLAAGEHKPSVVFTPSNLSDYTPVRAIVCLSVARVTPAISWPAPDPINSATPLGSAQLNASASIPGAFAYSPAAGETLGPGVHTLSVIFAPADSVNYALAQAGVSLTVTEITPAVITWPSPPSISYGTALDNEQLSASSSVPGSFLYIPAPGDVLPPGKHKLSVLFTPEDQERYAKVQAAVMLIVEDLPNVASHAPLGSDVTAQPSAVGAVEQGVAGNDVQPVQGFQRETRTYKGAIYEKGDDRQWHLQRK